MTTPLRLIAMLGAVLGAFAPTCTRAQESAPRSPGTRRAEPIIPLETIYDGALGAGWSDFGWTARDVGPGPVRVAMQSYGGWIVGRPAFSGRYGALTFRVQAPREWGDFLEVRVESDKKTIYPRIVVRAEQRVDLPGDWCEVVIPTRALDPEGLSFDRIVFRARNLVGPGVAAFDKIVLTRPADADSAPPPLVSSREVLLTIDCGGSGRPISPLIYGIAYDPMLDGKSRHQWSLGATARRWGGNPSSRFNWEVGNAWNTAQDWFFENVNYTGDPSFRWTRFLDDDVAHHLSTALTVPTLGWVAKDVGSYSFPVAEFGAQQAVDGYKPEAGNGKTPQGKSLASPDPSRTSVAAPPEWVSAWVRDIRKRDTATHSRSVDVYILDNEPMLWNSTHRDVHPEPVGYDELLARTIAYGEAVRAADPDGRIAGPAVWGWPAYFFSAKDAATSFRLAPDRRSHGDVPLLPWWLREVRRHENAVGHRLIDLVDVHFYPQEEAVGGPDGGIDAATSALRVRATRSLWDPTYVDESWIAAPIQLIPRLRQWIAENAPGMGIQIGEWNFGAEGHPSGGIAVAEMLGRFGQQGVEAAYYWTYPPTGSPAFWAFRAYRDFDGAGGHFLESSLATTAEDGSSLFASRDVSGTHVVAIVLNLRGDRSIAPTIALSGAVRVKSVRAFRYGGDAAGFVAVHASARGAMVTTEPLGPFGMSVLDIYLEG